MTQLQHVFKQITELDAVQREELAFALSEEMLPHALMLKWSSRYQVQQYPSIVSTPGVCGGEARLIRTRIPIWTLERMRQLGVSEIDILRSYPTLRAIDLVQAWSYASQHRNEIEKAILVNETDEE